jgi:hypothetical protein
MNNLDSALVEMAALADRITAVIGPALAAAAGSREAPDAEVELAVIAEKLRALRTRLADGDSTLLQNTADLRAIQNFLTIGRMKPVGHWPGGGLYLAIDRVMASCVPNWNSPKMGG